MGKTAELLADTLGQEKLTRLLRGLAARHAGGSFSASDVDAVAAELGEPMESLVGDWLDGTMLPGFVVSPIDVVRVADGLEKPRYQASVHVRNDESVAGHVKVAWHAGPPDEYGTAGPFRVEGNTSVEIGFVSASPPKWVSIDPYLSLNRDRLRIETSQREPIQTTNTDPFAGVRSSDWIVAQEGIVVDDLDAGFRIEREKPGDYGDDSLGSYRRHSMDTDGGVPIYPMCCGLGNGKWQRDYEPWAWGKYRHTFVRTTGGQGEEVAVFSVELPRSGSWRFDYHLPGRYEWRDPSEALRHENLGRFDIVLSSNGHDIKIAFDGSAAQKGWNDLGVYDLVGGTVEVRVSSNADRQLAISDAVRFTPMIR